MVESLEEGRETFLVYNFGEGREEREIGEERISDHSHSHYTKRKVKYLL